MAFFFNMPTLGQSMEEGTVVRWFKNEGDIVHVGDKLVEIMSDKANFEVEAEQSGVLRKILAQSDEIVGVSTPIAIFGTTDENIDAFLSGNTTSVSTPLSVPIVNTPGLDSPQIVHPGVSPSMNFGATTTLVASPRARRVADEKGIDIQLLIGTGTGIDGRIVERDVMAFVDGKSLTTDDIKLRMTPLAARIAADLGVDLGGLASGLSGSRINADAVRTHASSPAVISTSDGSPAIAKVIPFKGLKKMVADNVSKSRFTAPHVTLNIEVDMTETVVMFKKLVPEFLRSSNVKVTYTDILVKACAKALEDHPLANAALIGDEIRVYADINIGVAVATDISLMVPVLKGANRRSLAELSANLKGLVERCRSGKQTGDDLAGGTFSITNLGAFGIDTFDPIIVPPQSCILGVGRIAEKPAVVGGQIVVRSLMNLSLSFDHRVLDGAPAARFLSRVKELLECPLLIFAI